MAIERKLRRWQQAGLLDVATAERIRAHEAANSRPVALWAVIGLGLLALALGLVLIIAANWDVIPASTKLGIHWLATAAAAAGVWVGVMRAQRWQSEAALFLLGALVLGGIALQGQVYQLISPVWQPLLFWAALCAPVFLLAGRTRLTAITLALMLVWLAITAATEISGGLREPLAQGLALALPALLILLSFAHRGDSFAAGLRETGLLLMLAGGSVAHLAWASALSTDTALDMWQRLPLPALATLAVLLLARRLRPEDALVIATITLATFLATALVMVTPHGDNWAARLIGALSFIAMWTAIGWAAHTAGQRTLFGTAVGAIAFRLFIIYFELFGSLASTGIGLILAGLLVIGLAYGWTRLVRRWPARKIAS